MSLLRVTDLLIRSDSIKPYYHVRVFYVYLQNNGKKCSFRTFFFRCSRHNINVCMKKLVRYKQMYFYKVLPLTPILNLKNNSINLVYHILFKLYLTIFVTAFLRTEEGDRLPNNPSNSTCLPSTVDGIHCSLAGNVRGARYLMPQLGLVSRKGRSHYLVHLKWTAYIIAHQYACKVPFFSHQNCFYQLVSACLQVMTHK